MLAKYKKGYTVGTFDMFHKGHLNLLRQAKEYCDYLIVGVHSDDWVMKCKNRPTVIPYEDRAAIVSAIRYVDEVVKNETKSKIEAWKQYPYTQGISTTQLRTKLSGEDSAKKEQKQ